MDLIRILFIDDNPAIRALAERIGGAWSERAVLGKDVEVEFVCDDGVNPEINNCDIAIVDEFLKGGARGTGFLRQLDPANQAGILITQNPEGVGVFLDSALIRDVGISQALSLNGRVVAIPKSAALADATISESANDESWWNGVVLPAVKHLVGGVLTSKRAAKYALARLVDMHAWTRLDHTPREAAGSEWNGVITRRGEAMDRLVERLELDMTNPSLLLLLEGESGVGKDHLARALHQAAGRSRWIRMPEGTKEEMLTTLCGTCVGGWTDSKTEVLGLLEEAGRTAGSTIFFNEAGIGFGEIAERLRHVWDERVFKKYQGIDHRNQKDRVLREGGYFSYYTTRDNHFDVIGLQQPFWVIVATTRRLPVTELSRFSRRRIPSLKERLEDVMPLTNFFAAAEGGLREIQADAFSFLLTLPWEHGNVRLLKKIVQEGARRAKSLGNDILGVADLTWSAEGELGTEMQLDTAKAVRTVRRIGFRSTAEEYWMRYRFGDAFRAKNHYGNMGRWVEDFAKRLDRDALRLCVLRGLRECQNVPILAQRWGIFDNDDARKHGRNPEWIALRQGELMKLDAHELEAIAEKYGLSRVTSSGGMEREQVVQAILEEEQSEPKRYEVFRCWVQGHDAGDLGIKLSEVRTQETTNALRNAFTDWTTSEEKET